MQSSTYLKHKHNRPERIYRWQQNEEARVLLNLKSKMKQCSKSHDGIKTKKPCFSKLRTQNEAVHQMGLTDEPQIKRKSQQY